MSSTTSSSSRTKTFSWFFSESLFSSFKLFRVSSASRIIFSVTESSTRVSDFFSSGFTTSILSISNVSSFFLLTESSTGVSDFFSSGFTNSILYISNLSSFFLINEK